MSGTFFWRVPRRATRKSRSAPPLAPDATVLSGNFSPRACCCRWPASRLDLNETLSDGGRAAGAASTRSPLRSVLVVTEVALALVLLICAGLLIKSVMRLREVDPGFKPDRIVTMNVWLPSAKYPKAGNGNLFFNRMLERIEAIPGV